MVAKGRPLTTGEFSEMTGLAVATITHMLRQGKIKGEKQRGKWAIDESELQNEIVKAKMGRWQPLFDDSLHTDAPAFSGETYDVETFARMTYLTENGVRQWYRSGRLEGRTDDSGSIRIDAANLDRPELQHLIRS